MKVLVAGWFSFEKTGATAGDLLAKDLVCDWVKQAGYTYDIALASQFGGGVDWAVVNPNDYSHLIFVCGPFFRSNLLKRFENCRLVGINLSMMESVDLWNPFDLLLERDSSHGARPDLTFLARERSVPVVGVTLNRTPDVPRNRESYETANAAVERFIALQELSAVHIDTRLDITNTSGLRSPAEIESLISRMDVVLTTRLHGMVLALKNGVPVVAVDPVPGGKICRQAETIGWPVVFSIDSLTHEDLQKGLDYCLTEVARQKAKECSQKAMKRLQEVRATFIAAMDASSSSTQQWGDGRRRGSWVAENVPLASAQNKPGIPLPHLVRRLIRILKDG